MGKEETYIVIKAGSGSYQFVIKKVVRAQTQVDPALLDYLGKYKMKGMPFEFLEVTLNEGVLSLEAPSGGSALKSSASEHDLFTTTDNSTIRFVRDANKKVVKLKAEFMSMPFEGDKVP